MRQDRSVRAAWWTIACVVACAGWAGMAWAAEGFDADVRPMVGTYCVGCHSAVKHRGDLDLERFTSVEQVRREVKPWVATLEMLESGEMPPRGKPQPTLDERARAVAWVRGVLNEEARARAGDPGRVPLRRLSNAEYDCSVRDLTGVDLRPASEFPADGAAGEGFTNAAEALTDVTPALMGKYLEAAKEVSAHAVLLPDGFRFSVGKARPDWTNECNEAIRRFYAAFCGADGRLPIDQYLIVTVRHRGELAAGGQGSIADVARREGINANYLGTLWRTLSEEEPSFPLDRIRARWRRAGEADVPALVGEIKAWQRVLWKVVQVGSYRDGNTKREVANDPAVATTRSVTVAVKPVAGQGEVTVYLGSRAVVPGEAGGYVVWRRPRFEGQGQPALLLSEYEKWGRRYERDFAAIFGETAKYLAAVAEAAGGKVTADELAAKGGLDAALLKRWVELLDLRATAGPLGGVRMVAAGPLKLLDEQSAANDQRPAIRGWHRRGTDLPGAISNASDVIEHVPGLVEPHRVAVHPMPAEFVAAVWASPVEGEVRVAATVTHAHPACGNGVAWRLEHRRGGEAGVVAEGAVDLGGSARSPAQAMRVAKGDQFVLCVDARDGNHVCDLTEIELTVEETGGEGRVWSLSSDVANDILAGNPHADRFGNAAVWSFVEGRSADFAQAGGGKIITADSTLARWRDAVRDPARGAEAERLAKQVQTLLAGALPAAKSADRALYEKLVSADSALLKDLDLSGFSRADAEHAKFGLAAERFGRHPAAKAVDEGSLVVPVGEVIELRLPAAVFAGRSFVAEATLDSAGADGVVEVHAAAAPPPPPVEAPWDEKPSLLGEPKGEAVARLGRGLGAFRDCFPQFVCFPKIIPDDEVVCLKRYHRDDEPLVRLFLDEGQRSELERLWAEHRFVSQWPVAENKYLPQFIQFTTQDTPKEFTAYFEGLRGPFAKRAEQFEADVQAAEPRQWDALMAFAAKAYRRHVEQGEREQLRALYVSLKAKGVSAEAAFRGVLARVLASPSFLFRVEHAPAGTSSAAVNDWELATRLSYFLWSSVPDDELRELAAKGRLHEPAVLTAQALRMLADGRVRALAIEFGTQSIHVRGFDKFNEKNERLFPTFDADLRAAMYEESVLLFQDLFQRDESVTRLLDADFTYLNETLAKHYGIPGVKGAQFRRVDGVRQYGRGGILALGSVQSAQAAASRTSPVLRGNWVVETLLGEKLPRPPPDVPKLPEEEGTDGLTARQLVERHTSDAACAVCHQRIDPIGFCFERYDAIGRLRPTGAGVPPVDTKATLRDGTKLDGLDGLRDYLLTKKRDVVLRLFCRRLLGYALGRAAALSDQTTVDQMVERLNQGEGRTSALVVTIVNSPQFRMIRGADYGDEER